MLFRRSGASLQINSFGEGWLGMGLREAESELRKQKDLVGNLKDRADLLDSGSCQGPTGRTARGDFTSSWDSGKCNQRGSGYYIIMSTGSLSSFGEVS